jgi:hypothetical protein
MQYVIQQVVYETISLKNLLMKSFYPEDLLEYQYNEMSPERSLELEQALKENWSLRQKMEVIKEASERLNKSYESPRPQSIDYIMDYAAARSKATL